jgi:hypothetical protein
MTSRAKTLRPGPTETQVVQQVLDALLIFGVDVDRQNTGGCYDERGQFVRFGKAGNSDISGMLVAGPGRGKKIDVEVKRPGFDPTKLQGQKQEHFKRQLARLRRTNEQGGFGFWITDASQAIRTLERINQGWRVVIDDDGWPFVTDEPDPSPVKRGT